MIKHSGKILVAVLLAACNGPRRIHEAPVLVNGDRVRSPDSAVAMAARTSAAERATLRASSDSVNAQAVASCTGATCAALARGELSLGMSESQVLAATHTTADAWSRRTAGSAETMTARSLATPPRDGTGEVAMVQLAGGQVSMYAYREPQGLRVVNSPADASTEGRAAAEADALVREGDGLLAANDLSEALNRFDRASVLQPQNPMIQYRVAKLLDLQLRPLEALVQYQRFLNELEIDRIRAQGEAYGNLAAAIAQARERVIVLEKQTR